MSSRISDPHRQRARSTEGAAGSNASLQARTAGRNVQVVPPPSSGFGFEREAFGVGGVADLPAAFPGQVQLNQQQG
jgi:hypothetical protein